jgi:hypothetical protein
LLILVYVQLFCQDTRKRRAVYSVICNINRTILTLLSLDFFFFLSGEVNFCVVPLQVCDDIRTAVAASGNDYI